MIVADASLVANAVADDTDAGRAARRELGDAGELYAPDLVDVEVTSVVRRLTLAGTLEPDRARIALTGLRALPIERVPCARLIERAFELRETITVYDGVYVALAEVLGCEVVTLDEKLAAANGPRCRIRVVGR